MHGSQIRLPLVTPVLQLQVVYYTAVNVATAAEADGTYGVRCPCETEGAASFVQNQLVHTLMS